MATTIVVPTYWGRPQGHTPRPGDAIFDHPTPVDGESTLPRLLESLAQAPPTPSFDLLVLVAPVGADLAPVAEQRVREILSPFADRFPVALFGPSSLPLLQRAAARAGVEAHFITLANYAGVRNLQLLVPHALGRDVIIALDDDETVSPDYVRRAVDAIAGAPSGGVAGLYEDAGGSVYLPEPEPTGNIFLDKAIIMNEAIRRLVTSPRRLTSTAVAFGGNMVFRRDLFSQVSFDPGITRGEDLDYVLNARLKGFTFWLDKTLRVTHLPPRIYETHPYAKLAEDVRRFVYQREKLRQAQARGLKTPDLDDLMPYPGKFLGDDLTDQALDALAREASPEAVRLWGTPEDILAHAMARAQQQASAYFSFADRWPLLARAVRADAELRDALVSLTLQGHGKRQGTGHRRGRP